MTTGTPNTKAGIRRASDVRPVEAVSPESVPENRVGRNRMFRRRDSARRPVTQPAIALKVATAAG